MDPDYPEGLSAADWSNIVAAHEANRHAVREVDGGGFQARNSRWGWATRFDGLGFEVEPEAGGWTFGLQLVSYGFPGDELEVTKPERVRAEGCRVVQEWDSTLEEWYVNDGRGLEHGYTVHARPGHGEGKGEGMLAIELAVRGGLSGEVERDGRSARFLDAEAAEMLRYAGLCAFDAEGRELEASMEMRGDRLRLRVDDREARYPLTIDPIVQTDYLKASNTDPTDGFGAAVAISGDTVLVAAVAENSSSTGVNGNQLDNNAENSGAVYVFVRNAGVWSQQAYLKASNTDPFDHFGSAVAISGDTAIVAASGEDSASTGVNGIQLSNSADSSGAAYVFVRSGTTWSQQAYLKASNTEAFDRFACAVAILGDTIVIGANGECSSSTGVNGNQSDNGAYRSGAAYVFVRSGTTWSQQAYLKASNTDGGDYFGHSVATSGETAVVGALCESSIATGVNGDQSNNLSHWSGAVYVFVRSGTTWSQQAYLKASNSDSLDRFGVSVAISGDTAIVGTEFEASSATGVNADQLDNSALAAGAAYVFTRSGTTWSQQAYLKASNTDPGDHFGWSVAISGDTAIVGSWLEDSSSTGVNGTESDNTAQSAGAAYVFQRFGSTWTQRAYLKASNTDESDSFAYSVGISGDTAIVGAGGEDSASTGVNSDQSDNTALNAGAAYIYVLPVYFSRYCSGGPGSGTPCPCGNDNDGTVPQSGCANGVFASGAQLSGDGVASVSQDSVVLHATHAEPNNFGLYFQGDNRVNGGDGAIFGDGLRCAGGSVVRLEARAADALGNSFTTIPLAVKGSVMPGDVKRYQFWYRNAVNSPCGTEFNLSNGLEVTWDL